MTKTIENITTEYLTVHLESNVLSLVWNRPERKNALTTEMYLQAAQLLKDAEQNPEVRCIILSGVGGDFTAGNDMTGFSADTMRDADAPAFVFLRALNALTKPIIAAIEGVAIGIGTTSLLHCDFVYAHPNTRLQMPFVRLGLIPEGAASLLIPSHCGYKKAAEWLMLANPIDLEEALSGGLLTSISETPLEMAQATARQLNELPMRALVATKVLLRDQSAIETRINQEAKQFIAMCAESDCLEAIAAFKEKRRPQFNR